jgi:hypothetical protein
MKQDAFEAEVAERSGMGAILAELLATIVFDREDLPDLEHEEIVEIAERRGEEWWNGIIGPALDELTEAVRRDRVGAL